MNEFDCTSLDDFLAGDLPTGGDAVFESHLRVCDTCRQAVADWRSLRGLLQEAAQKLEVPAELAQRIEREYATRPRARQRSVRKLVLAVGTAACATLSIVYATIHWPPVMRDEVTDRFSSDSRLSTIATPALVELPDDVIGVPIDIDEPGVTVVWLYPIVQQENISN